MKYTLFAVRIFVTNWDRAVGFYTETLGMGTTFRDDDMGWLQLDTGAGQLALERASDSESMGLVGRFLGVSLKVDDFETTHDVLVARGVEFLSPPEPQPWGGTLAHFKDPDNNVLTLLG